MHLAHTCLLGEVVLWHHPVSLLPSNIYGQGAYVKPHRVTVYIRGITYLGSGYS